MGKSRKNLKSGEQAAADTDENVSAGAAVEPAVKKKKAAKTEGEAKAPGSGKKLVIVESPAKAKTINRYLGRDFIVKASMGHVRDLPEKGFGVDLENGFIPTYEPLSGRKKVLSELKKTAESSPEIFLATDLDREGEAIAWHLAESLHISPQRLRRVVFNEITATAIRAAFEHPRQIDMNKVNAQQARRILDRIVGYKVSPLLWRKVARGLSAGRVQSVAVRLIVEREREIEAFMPEEYWKVSAIFTPDIAGAAQTAQKWRQFLQQRDEKGNGPTRDSQTEFLAACGAFAAELTSFNGEKFKASDADQAVKIAKALGLAVSDVRKTEDPSGKGSAKNLVTVIGSLDKPPAFAVSSVNRRQSRVNPPRPLNTAALQQAASVQIRFSASRTMRIAQQLYEGIDVPGEETVGLITYMRTDSVNISGEALTAVRKLIGEKFGNAYLPEKPNFYASAQRAQEAHESIRPTEVARTPQSLMGALSDEQYKLYDLIWKRFVACQMTPAVWSVTEADIAADTPAGKAVFRAMGRTLAFDGFFKVTGVPSGGEPTLPELSEGRQVAPVEINPTQHFTQPPPRYTEASLVKTLEAQGIGRPSTYASIIQTIQDRNYVELPDRAFRPTNLGLVVTDKLVNHFPEFFDVQFTAKMEDELDKIEESKLDWVGVLDRFYGPFSRTLEKATQEMVHAKAETQPSEYVCDQCGKPMVYRLSSKGDRYLACTGYPECKTTCPVDKEGKKVVRIEVDVPCPQCGGKMILRRSRFGAFLGCSKYPECKGILSCDKDGQPLKTVKAEEIKQECPQCGAPMAVKFKGRRAFLGCSKYPDCKTTAPMPDGVRVEPPPRPQPKQAGANCPKCGKAMLIRIGKRGEFLACSGFPKCRNAMSLDKLQELLDQQAKKTE
ncbi:MAG: type I DNA topoisomerase [Planctomycetes bacterium]|nr:type I DNA topoisomerase [Planctomycetota bacterium]